MIYTRYEHSLKRYKAEDGSCESYGLFASLCKLVQQGKRKLIVLK
jgi:hypothetical protein